MKIDAYVSIFFDAYASNIFIPQKTGGKNKKMDLLKDIKNYDTSKNMEENLLSPIKAAKTIKEAESIANKMGVDVVYNDLKVSNYVNEALELIKNKKEVLPEKVVFEEKESDKSNKHKKIA